MPCVVLLAGCASGDPPEAAAAFHELQGEAFGTTWSVKWRGPAPTEAAAESAIVEALEAVDARMSSWRSDSEINEARRAGGPHPVSEETHDVVLASLQLAEETGGAFDPTVEPLMALWGFRGKPREEPPTGDEIEATLATIGWSSVVPGRTAEGTPTVDTGGTALDLSAIAKGHAVDRVAWELSALGSTDHLVEIGGEVRASGSGPSGLWRLAVDSPSNRQAPGTTFAAMALLRNAGMATSGNYRSAYDAGGTRVVHTMDPRTGRPHASEVASATVVAPDCRTADGWATALMVLPPDEGIAAIEGRPELEALLLLASEAGFSERRSSGMGRWLEDAR